VAGPVVGITMGDAAGIGPEVTMKALGDAEMYAICRPVVIGDARILERANHVVDGALSINRISRPADGRFELGRVDCVDLDLLPADLPFGQISAVAGDAAFRYVERAIELPSAPLRSTRRRCTRADTSTRAIPRSWPS